MNTIDTAAPAADTAAVRPVPPATTDPHRVCSGCGDGRGWFAGSDPAGKLVRTPCPCNGRAALDNVFAPDRLTAIAAGDGDPYAAPA